MVAALLAPVALTGCDLGGGTSATASPTTDATTTEEVPQEVFAPENLRVKPGTFRATLRWDPGPGGLPVQDYDIYRDGRLVTSLPGEATSWVDEDVVPRKKYRWEIRAKTGELTSENVAVTARTKVPPLSAARLEGDFSLTGRTTTHSGYTTVGGPLQIGWRFDPKCLQGICRRVAWRDIHNRKIRGVLVRNGARYTGTYTGWFFTHCQNTRTTSSITIELRVKKAQTVQREWHATRLVGTIRSSETSQLGCVSSSATRAIRGRLHPSSL